MTEQIYLKKQLVSTGHRFSGETWANDNLNLDIHANVKSLKQESTNTPIEVPVPVSKSKADSKAPENRIIDMKKIKETITITGDLTGSTAATIKNQLIAMQQMGGMVDEFKWREEVFNAANNNAVHLDKVDFTDELAEGQANLLDQEIAYGLIIVLSIGKAR